MNTLQPSAPGFAFRQRRPHTTGSHARHREEWGLFSAMAHRVRYCRPRIVWCARLLQQLEQSSGRELCSCDLWRRHQLQGSPRAIGALQDLLRAHATAALSRSDTENVRSIREPSMQQERRRHSRLKLLVDALSGTSSAESMDHKRVALGEADILSSRCSPVRRSANRIPHPAAAAM